MSEFLSTRLGEIHSGPLLSLIDELEHACPVGSRHFVGLTLFQFLTQCVYPGGSEGKRVPITTALALDTPLLDSKVGKLPDGDLHDLCAELTLRSNEALEWYSGNKLTVLLNKTLPKFALPKRSGPKQGRSDAVAMQRRANRGR